MATTPLSSYFQDACLLEILNVVKRQELLLGEIMTQLNELPAELQAIADQLEKAKAEIIELEKAKTEIIEKDAAVQAANAQLTQEREANLARIAVPDVELKAALQNVALTPDAEVALANAKSGAQTMDNLTPDQPVA